MAAMQPGRVARTVYIMTFRPDSPLNRLVLLWPGVPIGACALGFGLALYGVGQTQSGGFAALAIAMGFGLALGLGLLFHTFFIAWLEVSVTREGIFLQPLGFAWLGSRPRMVPWSHISGAREIVTRGGPQLTITAPDQLYRLPRVLFREDTYTELCQILTAGGADLMRTASDPLAAAA